MYNKETPLLLLYYFCLFWLQDLENDSASSELLQSPISPQKLENEHETKIVLKSMKMKSMKDLLVAKKLNTQAMHLLLSA